MRMAVIKVIFAAAALSAAITPLRAEIRILASPGGEVGPFLDLFDRVRASGERVVIDGPCLSACTLVLMTIPEERICVTRRAVLGFHAARSIDRRGRTYAEPEASRAVQESYPGPVRDWISRRGGLTSRMLLLRGRELAAIYPGCFCGEVSLGGLAKLLNVGNGEMAPCPPLLARPEMVGTLSLCPPDRCLTSS